MSDLFKNLGEHAGNFLNKVKDAASKVAGGSKKLADATGDKLAELKDVAADKANDVKDVAEKLAQDVKAGAENAGKKAKS